MHASNSASQHITRSKSSVDAHRLLHSHTSTSVVIEQGKRRLSKERSKGLGLQLKYCSFLLHFTAALALYILFFFCFFFNLKHAMLHNHHRLVTRGTRVVH